MTTRESCMVLLNPSSVKQQQQQQEQQGAAATVVGMNNSHRSQQQQQHQHRQQHRQQQSSASESASSSSSTAAVDEDISHETNNIDDNSNSQHFSEETAAAAAAASAASSSVVAVISHETNINDNSNSQHFSEETAAAAAAASAASSSVFAVISHETNISDNSSSQHFSEETAAAAAAASLSVVAVAVDVAVAANVAPHLSTSTTTTAAAAADQQQQHRYLPVTTEETASNEGDDDVDDHDSLSDDYSQSSYDSSDYTRTSDDVDMDHPHRSPNEQQQQQQEAAVAGESSCQSSQVMMIQRIQSSSRIPTITRTTTTHAASSSASASLSPIPPAAAAAAVASCTTKSSVVVEAANQQHQQQTQKQQHPQQQETPSTSLRKHQKTTTAQHERSKYNSDEDVDMNNDEDDIDTNKDNADDGDDDDFELALVWQRNKRVLLGRLEESIPRGRLSLINLSRRGLGLQEAILLKHAIQSNPQLSVLKLGYNDLRDAGVVVIAQAFQCSSCPNTPNNNNNNSTTATISISTTTTTNNINKNHHASLAVLDLGFNNFGNAGVEALAVHALAGNYTLETLYLSGNDIGPKGAFSIAAAILHGTGLCTLHLAGNQIGAVGIKAIAGAIAESDVRQASAVAAAATAVATVGRASNTISGGGNGVDGDNSNSNNNSTAKSMIELHVGNANIGSAGFLAIPAMLLSNITLRSLSVTNNGIDDQAMLLLSQALSQNKNVPLETMHFSFNEITDQGVECLMNAVWGSKFLRNLKLDNNKIQDRGAQLCAVVLTSIPLHVLDLSFNRVTTTGIKALMRNISENDSLHTLGLSGIHIDQHASKAVSFALAYNSSLNVLYLDDCSAGYSAQRHIVAGVVSNRRASLRVLTGFALAPITMTLGMPQIPEEWSNEQLLGFVRLMWQQWLVKSGHGNVEEAQSIRGPAPPAAVAAAAKIAFSSLGMSPQKLFQTETHDKPLSEGAPVDSASSALLERTQSGTLWVPPFSEQYAGQVLDWVYADSKARVATVGSPTATVHVPSLDDPEQRNRNLQWLRTHFRSLSEVGRLPFNNADLWQLHQYYFSPPVYPSDDGSDKSTVSEAEGSVAVQSSQDDAAVAPPPTPAAKAPTPPVGRAISFHALGDALAAQGLVGSASKNNKRRSSQELEEDYGPASKRAKNLKPRIAYYPRLMAKIKSLGTRPMDQTLSLLRQLKYTENLMFAGMDPYGEFVSPGRVHRDIEMILVDLL